MSEQARAPTAEVFPDGSVLRTRVGGARQEVSSSQVEAGGPCDAPHVPAAPPPSASVSITGARAEALLRLLGGVEAAAPVIVRQLVLLRSTLRSAYQEVAEENVMIRDAIEEIAAQAAGLDALARDAERSAP